MYNNWASCVLPAPGMTRAVLKGSQLKLQRSYTGWPLGYMRLTRVHCSVFTVYKIGISCQHFKDFWLSLKIGSSNHVGSSCSTTTGTEGNMEKWKLITDMLDEGIMGKFVFGCFLTLWVVVARSAAHDSGPGNSPFLRLPRDSQPPKCWLQDLKIWPNYENSPAGHLPSS